MKFPKDLRAAVKEARHSGWTVDTASGRLNSHILFRGPHGERVTAPSTPSDHRSFANTVHDLRRAGLDV